MLKILLNGDEFNKEREERQPSLSEFTERHNTSAGTAASVLPMVAKVIHFPVIRRAKPTSDRADSKEESDGEMLLSLPSWRPLWKEPAPCIIWSSALGKLRKNQGLRHSRKKKICCRASERKKMFWVCAKLQWIIVQICESSMWIHARLSCCAAITNVLCALQTCLRFAHLSMWSDHHSSTAEPFWLLMDEAFLAWSRCEIIPPNIFAIASQIQLYCLSFPTGQEHSRGQSSQCSWHRRILILKMNNS